MYLSAALATIPASHVQHSFKNILLMVNERFDMKVN